MKTRDMAYISISAALIALCAWLSIPAAIPFTMQTFAVFAVSGTLGARRGALALGVYILLGALGLPVFSGFQGGPGALLGATGGYIVGFLPAALIAGLGAEHLGRSLPALIFSMCAGLLACYALGTAWYVAVYARAARRPAFSRSWPPAWCPSSQPTRRRSSSPPCSQKGSRHCAAGTPDSKTSLTAYYAVR